MTKKLSLILTLSLILGACGPTVTIDPVTEEPLEKEPSIEEEAGEMLLPPANDPVSAEEADTFFASLENSEDFKWTFENSEQAKSLLAQNKFVVTPAYNEEFYAIYENNRYRYVPNFITTDSMLHNYHLAFDFLLRNLEEEILDEVLRNLLAGMYAEAMTQLAELEGTSWENAAKRNLAYVTVARKLLGEEFETEALVQEIVTAELALLLSLIHI